MLVPRGLCTAEDDLLREVALVVVREEDDASGIQGADLQLAKGLAVATLAAGAAPRLAPP